MVVRRFPAPLGCLGTPLPLPPESVQVGVQAYADVTPKFLGSIGAGSTCAGPTNNYFHYTNDLRENMWSWMWRPTNNVPINSWHVNLTNLQAHTSRPSVDKNFPWWDSNRNNYTEVEFLNEWMKTYWYSVIFFYFTNLYQVLVLWCPKSYQVL